MTRVTRHEPSLDNDSMGYPHSAPSSPSLLRSATQRSHNHTFMDQTNIVRITEIFF